MKTIAESSGKVNGITCDHVKSKTRSSESIEFDCSSSFSCDVMRCRLCKTRWRVQYFWHRHIEGWEFRRGWNSSQNWKATRRICKGRDQLNRDSLQSLWKFQNETLILRGSSAELSWKLFFLKLLFWSASLVSRHFYVYKRVSMAFLVSLLFGSFHFWTFPSPKTMNSRAGMM